MHSWRYSSWNATITGLFFAGFGILYYFKNNQQLHVFEVIAFIAGTGYIIYGWSGRYDKMRRERGYYEDPNPPLAPNLLQMAGQIIGYAGVLSITIGGETVCITLMLSGLALIALGGISLYYIRKKSAIK